MATSSSRDSAPACIAVLGSAGIAAGDPRWQAAYAMGSDLASRGWITMTGGYGGLMGAVALGANAAGGHTIGLPMTPWAHLAPHEANTELRWSQDYGERIAHLLSADVAVALPGGVGTLAEAAMVWAAAQTEPATARLIVVGDAWRSLVQLAGMTFVISPTDVGIPVLVSEMADVPEAVAAALTRARRPGRSAG